MNSDKQITVGGKVTIACVILVSLTLLVGGVALNSFFDLKGKLHQMVDRVLPGVYGMSAVRTTTKDMREFMLLHATAGSVEETARLEAAIQKFDAKIRQEMKAYEARMDADGDREIWAPIVTGYDTMVRIWEDRLRPLGRAGQQSEALAVYREELIPAREKLAAALDLGVAYNRRASKEAAEKAGDSADRGHIPILVIMGAASVVGIALTLMIVGGVNRNLRQAIAQLQEVAETIRHTAAQVSALGRSIASGATQQAESLATTFGGCDMIGAEMESSIAGLVESTQLMGELSNRLSEKSTETLSEESAKLAGRIESCLTRVRDSSRDQAHAMNSVTFSLSEIEQVTNAAAKEAGMGAAASQRMTTEAHSLTTVVNQLRRLVDGSAEAAHDDPDGQQGPGGLHHLERAVSNTSSAMESEPVSTGNRT